MKRPFWRKPNAGRGALAHETSVSTYSTDKQAAISLSSIFALRMLAVFMLLPVFTVYAEQLNHATPFLVGVAVGVYGFTQAVCQLPLGAWSDRWGRKPIIVIGLLLLALGSLVGALTDSIYGMIIARSLQGAGAIGSTLMALLADLTSDKNRTKAMALMGIAMGLSFILSLVAGPVVAGWLGFSGLFSASIFLTAINLMILYLFVPISPSHAAQGVSTLPMRRLFRQVLNNQALWPLNIGIFLLHAIFTALFYACPLVLKPLLPTAWDTSLFYGVILCIAVAVLFPCIMLAEKKQKVSEAFIISIGLLGVAVLWLVFDNTSTVRIGIALVLFFIGFNFLEATLPSWISKIAPAALRGTAMSVYSCAQFLGIFVGGIAAGIVYSGYSAQGVFVFAAFLAVVWFFIAVALKKRIVFSNH